MLVSPPVILFSLLLGNTMGMRGAIVQFGSSLMILVMGSVVISSGHIRYSLSALTWCVLPLQACMLHPSTPALVPNARSPLSNRPFRYVPRQYDGHVPQVRAARRLSGVRRTWCFLLPKCSQLSCNMHEAGQTCRWNGLGPP